MYAAEAESSGSFILSLGDSLYAAAEYLSEVCGVVEHKGNEQHIECIACAAYINAVEKTVDK